MREIPNIHEPFMAWLKKLRVPYHRNRPDKRTTAIEGDPDFLVTWMSHCCYIECKVPGNTLSEAQEKRIAYLRSAGNKVVVAYSLEECIDACHNILCIKDCPRGFDADFSPHFAKMKETVSAVGKDDGHEPPADFGRMEPTAFDYARALADELNPKPPVNGNRFIGKIGDTDYLFEGSGAPGTSATMLRPATQADLMELKRCQR